MMIKYILLLVSLFAGSSNAAAGDAINAEEILNKTAAVVNNKKGVQADFSLSGEKIERVSGTIAVKGNKFHVTTPYAAVWFDGKTQWAYMNKTDEVNITAPSKEQQVQMNPLTFINLYKTGYKLSATATTEGYEVRMQAEDSKNSIQEMYVVVDKSAYIPVQVRIRRNSSWITIQITGFKAAPQSDSAFTFNKNDFPTAEIIDLR